MTRQQPPLPPGCPPDSIVLTFPVAHEHAGRRLDRYLQYCIPRLSRTRAQEIVRACAYRADGTRRRASDRVRAGEVVMIVRPRMNEPETPLHFGILHDDAAVLAVDKPAGLPMHPTATYHRHTLTYLLRQRYGESPPHIAHRLDRETSGVVLCGKTRDAEVALKHEFARRRVDKTYLAIVRGELVSDAGVIEAPLAPVREGLHLLMEVRDSGPGSEARTEYRVIERRLGQTLLALHPTTGRQHQLRVHLASIGHAILGDKLYGPDGPAPFFECIETGMTDALRRWVGHDRQALHAHTVHLQHPTSLEQFTVTSPLAPDLVDLWNAPVASLTRDSGPAMAAAAAAV